MLATGRSRLESSHGPPRQAGLLDDVLESVERREIIGAIRRSGFHVTRAAAMLQISRSRLYRRMQQTIPAHEDPGDQPPDNPGERDRATPLNWGLIGPSRFHAPGACGLCVQLAKPIQRHGVPRS